MSVIDEIASVKEVRVKKGISEWFDGEVIESVKERDKLFKKFNQTSNRQRTI